MKDDKDYIVVLDKKAINEAVDRAWRRCDLNRYYAENNIPGWIYCSSVALVILFGGLIVAAPFLGARLGAIMRDKKQDTKQPQPIEKNINDDDNNTNNNDTINNDSNNKVINSIIEDFKTYEL